MMIARFQRDIHRCAACFFSRRIERVDFCMRLTGAFMPALPYHFSFAHDNAAHARIRAGGVQTLLGKTQSLRHVTVIVRGKHHEIKLAVK